MLREELLEYFKTERVRFEKTRDIQWRFNIALWTLLALAISFLKKNNIGGCYCLLVLALFLFLMCHFLFALLTQKGLIGSRMLSGKILDALNEPLPKENKEEISFGDRRIKKLKWNRNDRLWIIFQLLGSLVLMIVLVMKLTSPTE